MKTPNSIENVAEFHRVFKHPIEARPIIPSPKRSQLRVSLIVEELKELQEGIEKNNLIEIADALCDIQYVLAGAILEFGLGDKFKDLFNEVHRSNMSKAAKSQKEAEDTIVALKKENIEAYYEKADDLFLIYRQSDHKIMKAKNYSPARLEQIINV